MTLGATTTLWGENTDFLLQTIAFRELVLIHYCLLFSFRWHQLKAINSVNFFKFCNCCNSFKSKNKASFLMFTTWDVAKFASVLLWSYVRFETQTLKYSFSLHITRFVWTKRRTRGDSNVSHALQGSFVHTKTTKNRGFRKRTKIKMASFGTSTISATSRANTMDLEILKPKT